MPRPIISEPSDFQDRTARLGLATALGAKYDSSQELNLLCFKPPEQIISVRPVPFNNVNVTSTTVGEEFLGELASSLSTAFFVGPRAACEALFAQWGQDCVVALNSGLTPDETDSALLALWSHPTKDMVLVGVLGGGDWAADLEGKLAPATLGVTQIAFSGNDNDISVFLPDFFNDSSDDFSETELSDIAETVIANTEGQEWIDETLEGLADYLGVVDNCEQLLANQVSIATNPSTPKLS